MSKRLIENWLPIAELGEESIRERRSMSAVLEVLPPSEAYVGFAPADAVQPAAGDFETLENMRHLAFGQKVYRPRQLNL